MVRILGILLAVIFAMLGFFHLYWAAGGRFGIGAAVPTVGGERLLNPSPFVTILVAAALFAAMLVVLGRLKIWGAFVPGWIFYSAVLLLLFIASPTSAQTPDSLRREIQQIVSTKNAVVGVSIVDSNQKDTLSINADKRFPMQSVFKFHIAVAVLSEIDKGKFSLNQKIKIEKRDLLPDYYSPIKDKYPDGVTLTISEILKYTVSASDNVGCDVLLRLIGGPEAVEKYFVKNKFKNVSRSAYIIRYNPDAETRIAQVFFAPLLRAGFCIMPENFCLPV